MKIDYSKKIIAVDFGCSMGVARILPSGLQYETVNLSKMNRKRNKFRNYYEWMAGQLQNCELLVVEEVRNHMGILAAHQWGYWYYTACVLCETVNVELVSIPVKTIKKSFTGNGNATKEQVLQRCKDLKCNPDSYDAADAIAIMYTYLSTVSQP